MTEHLSAAEAARRLVADRDLLDAAVDAAGDAPLDGPYRVHDGPLGDFCESLHDLLAHVSMWDEISLAVLAEARRGRHHWSLDPRWETPKIGRDLNRAGVAAGRLLPSDLMRHRFASARAALVDEFTAMTEGEWALPAGITHPAAATMGDLAHYAMTVPGAAPFWHAAIHLGAVERLAS